MSMPSAPFHFSGNSHFTFHSDKDSERKRPPNKTAGAQKWLQKGRFAAAAAVLHGVPIPFEMKI
jgi:hypothetical protein